MYVHYTRHHIFTEASVTADHHIFDESGNLFHIRILFMAKSKPEKLFNKRTYFIKTKIIIVILIILHHFEMYRFNIKNSVI